MKRLFYGTVVLLAVVLALALNLRAAHLFAVLPDRAGALASVISGDSGLRAGRVRIAPGWSGQWARARLCGSAPCWDIKIAQTDGSTVVAKALFEIAGQKVRIEETSGRLRGGIDLPGLGAVEGELRVDTGDLALALMSQSVLSGLAMAQIERLELAGLALGRGPVRLRVSAPNQIQITAQLAGGPSQIDARIDLDLDAREGRVDMTFGDLGAFPSDLRAGLLRATTEEDGRRRLRFRLRL